MSLLSASAVHTSAAAAALALAIVLGSRNIHDNSGDKALLSLNEDVSSVAASFLHTLALVSAIAVTAGVGRHSDS